MIFLPHQQTMLNVHRPQYTLMFETLLSTEPPWLYLHAQLPEPSIENLGNEEYALPQEYGGAHGPKAFNGSNGPMIQHLRKFSSDAPLLPC